MIETNDKKKIISYLEKKTKAVLDNKKFITFAFCGGRSILQLFPELEKSSLPWKDIQIFMVDERLVPLESEHSNFKQLKEQLLDKLISSKKLPETNIHPFNFRGKKEDTKKYEETLKEYGGNFDIVFLGVGEDCHVAALFPNYSIKEDAEYFFTLHDSPKPPKDRMTSSRRLLLKSSLGIFLFIGDSKKEAYDRFKERNISLEDCPVKIASLMKDSIIYNEFV